MLTTADGFSFSTARTIDVSPTSGIDNLAAATGTTATYTGVLSDSGALVVGDGTRAGTVVFTGSNAYSGGTTITAGTLQIGNGGASGSIVGDVFNNGALAFNHSDVITFANVVSGTGTLSQIGPGTLILTGTNTYSGGTTITEGTLEIGNGGTRGSIVGDVLNNGNLAFNHSDAVTFPGTVSGTGSLSQIGTGTLILTGSSNYTAAAPTQFWNGSNIVSDGTVHGGTGTWINFVNTNFTNAAGTVNQAWQNGVAIFGAAVGTVTLGSDILFQGMQFSTDGYTVAGAGAFALHPTGTANITTEIGVTATITAPIAGAGGLNKAGPGLLTLSGDNTYSGGTTISGGALRVASDTNLGDPSVGIELNGGELETSADLTTARAIILVPGLAGANTFGAAASTTAIYTGVISGTGGLTVGKVADSGTVMLTNVNNTYTGGTTISGATLSVSNDTNLGNVGSGLILDGGELMANGSGFITSRSVLITANNGTVAAEAAGVANFQGNITGSGALTIGDPVNTGIVDFKGTNTYLGGTTIVSGTTLKALSIGALSPASAFIVTGILDLNGFSNQIGSLTGSGEVTNGGLAAAVLTAGGDNTSTTLGALLQDGTASLALTKIGTGTLTLLTNSTYSGGTTISEGTLQIGNGGTSGSIGRDVTDNGNLTFDRSDAVPFSGVVSGTGTLSQNGPGTTILTGDNTYTGGTTINGGTLQIGDGGNTGSIVGDVIDNAELVVNRSGTMTLAGVVSGTGNLNQVGPGTLILTGASTYTGATAVSAGTLQVDGGLGNTAVTVQNGATLVGQGTIAGSVTVLDGGHLAQGSVAQTLSVGSLLLKPASILNYRLDLPGVVGSGVNTLVNVGSNLTLDGILNVTDGGQFGSGSYRLLNYNGALTNLTLALGTLPDGFTAANTTVTTAVAGQVNLVVNASGAPVQFWDGSNTVNDGTVHGGTGTWINFATNNSTNAAGTVNEAWQNGFAIFTAAPGTVTLGGDILFQGMQFSIDGYTIEGAEAFALHPTGTAMIITDGGVTATIDAPIAGVGGLNKSGPGLLNLTGENTYRGGTTVSGGTLRVISDANLGDASGGLTLDGGELETSADFTTARTVNLVIPGLNGANILAAAVNTTATYTGTMSGDGANPGTVVLTNLNNFYSGGTKIFPGTLVAAGTDTLGTGPVQLFNGTLTILAGVTLPNEVTFVAGGVLDNAGTLNNNVLDAPDKAVTVINSGTINGNVQLAGSSDIVHLFTGSKITGSLTLGAASNNSMLILDGAGQQLLSLAVAGTLANNGTLVKQGSGTWTADRALAAPLGTDVLTGTLVVDAALTTARVNIASGAVLQLNSESTAGSLVDNGSLIFAGSGTVSFGPVISGMGNVIQNGPGTTILSGRNTYSGGTIIDLGTLLVNNPQALGTGNVTVNGGVLGADPQPINILGNYTQNAVGTLQLNIAGRAPGQFDVLNVARNAFLNGSLRLLNLGYQPQSGDGLRLVNTGGAISGRFAQFDNPFTFGAGFNTVALVYARQSVTLEFLELNNPSGVVSTTDFGSFALTPNERAIASLLNAVQLDPRAANLISFLNKEPFANLPGDFNKISPEGLTAFYEISFSNANIQRLNLEGRLDDLRNGSNGFSSNMKVNGASLNLDGKGIADEKSSQAVVEPILQHTPENRWGVWVTGFGDFVSVDADSNANGYNFTTGGVSLGMDCRITDQLAIGVMGEYSHTWTALEPSGHIDVDSGRGGLYATWSDHGIYLNAAIYSGRSNYDSSRSGLKGLATGATGGAEWSTFISGGYDFHFGPLTVGPITALQYTYANIDGFSENGSLAPLAIHSNSAESLRSDFGFRLFYQRQIGNVLIEPSLKAVWEHEYKYSALPITAGFARIPGPSANLFGPSEGHDSVLESAGVSAQLTPSLSIYVNYEGQLGRERYDSNAVTGGVRIGF